ncbi:MAG TPA: helix-turn-helix domain-containing protein [Microbacterium sp.]|uniref:TetR/AcrR family transcriptional regulator n=1 Tax=Microbacterium sp. TaxID=51671 RepID=UPI002B483B1A|nr:helix-turn-helix domain-containing protein [Microbacterium sp.]HKT56214.1 helix-turn-helix domain-containing protein [Microbacterium sp.]
MAVKAAVRTKVRLDPDRIIAAGLELAARPGVSAISVRELGTMLGADPTAIYRHFRSKDDLMRALLDHILAGSLAEVDAGAPWDERLRQLAERTLVWAARYPAIAVESVVLTTHGPGELGAVELMLDAFREAGLSDDEIVRHYALLASHSLSGAAGIARARAEAPGEEDAWLDEPLIADPRRYPMIARYGARLSELRDVDLLMRGVEMITESARRAAASR